MEGLEDDNGSVLKAKFKGLDIEIRSKDVLFYVGFLAASILFAWLAQQSEEGSFLSYLFASLTVILMVYHCISSSSAKSRLPRSKDAFDVKDGGMGLS